MTHRCDYCGNDSDLLEITGYDWDSDDDAALSISRVTGYICRNVTECAERIVEQGDSIEGLKMVAGDHEHLGELATQAREILHEWSEMAQAEAYTADLAARENGYGTIGR